MGSTKIQKARAALRGALPPTVLMENDYYRIERLFGDRILRIVRMPRAFVDVADVEKACEPVQIALDAIGRTAHCALLDYRAISGRNDPSSERVWAGHRRRMATGFQRVAVVVETPAGRLQAERLVREDKTPGRVFLAMEEAIEYLELAREDGEDGEDGEEA